MSVSPWPSVKADATDALVDVLESWTKPIQVAVFRTARTSQVR